MFDYRLSVKEIGMLKEVKWAQWSRKVKGALRAHGKWSYIEGSQHPSPQKASADIVVWDTAKNCIVGALCGVIEDLLVQEVEKLTTPRRLGHT